MNTIDTFSDAFNARHLSITEIARDFVVPSQFKQLANLNHCVIYGPRGSGKTTLLKMLGIEAACHLSNNRPDFIGIFVPADVRWGKQLESKIESLSRSEDYRQISNLAFCSSIILSFLDSLQKCFEISQLNNKNKLLNKFLINNEKKTVLFKKLADLWKVNLEIPSLFELRHQIRKVQSNIPKISAKFALGHTTAELAVDFPFIENDWLSVIVAAIGTVNDIIEFQDLKWSLLLDELEIVPDSLRNEIFEALRSASDNLIFKISLSPSGKFSSEKEITKQPSSGNDFKTIYLSYVERTDMRVFSETLFLKALERKVNNERTLLDILGTSNLGDDDIENSSTAKERFFQELAGKDITFKNFLDRHEIDPKNLDTRDVSKVGPLVRKISPLVFFRNKAIKSFADGGLYVKNGGKISYDAFHGYPSILDLTEGNPRWILNLVDFIVTQSQSRKQDISSQGVQTAAIKAFSSRFASMLRIFPVEDKNEINLSLYQFLEKLSDHIKNNIYYSNFTEDPPLSFVVDDHSYDKYGSYIATAIHLGALVIMDHNSTSTGDSDKNINISNKRVRLCYRLCPEFFIPLRSTKVTSMANALSEVKARKEYKTPRPKKIRQSNRINSEKDMEMDISISQMQLDLI